MIVITTGSHGASVENLLHCAEATAVVGTDGLGFGVGLTEGASFGRCICIANDCKSSIPPDGTPSVPDCTHDCRRWLSIRAATNFVFLGRVDFRCWQPWSRGPLVLLAAVAGSTVLVTTGSGVSGGQNTCSWCCIIGGNSRFLSY